MSFTQRQEFSVCSSVSLVLVVSLHGFVVVIFLEPEEICEEEKAIIFHLSLFSRSILLQFSEERLEIEPSKVALVLVFGFNQTQKVVLGQVLQLDVFFVTSRTHSVPFFFRSRNF